MADDTPAAHPTRRGQRDLTTGPIGRTLLVFALPTLASNILQSMNGSINAIWVGRFLGESALAATSNANIIMFLMFGAVFGFGMASTILVGQAFGRRDLDEARRAFGTAIGLVAIASLVVAVAGYHFTPAILKLLATPEAALPFATDYLRVTFVGLPSSMLLVLMFMGLRGTGDSMTPLWFMGLSVVIDSGLNPFFILGLGPFPRWGIAGSAFTTLLGNSVAVLALAAYIHFRRLPLRLEGRQLGYLIPARDLIGTIVAKGLPIGAQMLVMSTAGLTMIGLVNRQGVETTAAYGVAQQLWAYIQMPAMAIGAAVSAMAAQNIGAGKWDRVGRITWSGAGYNVLLTGAIVVLFALFDRPVLALFVGGQSPALPIARHVSLIASWGFVLFGVSIVIFGTVRANGAVWGPLAILFVAMYPVRIGFAMSLLPAWGAEALWWSFPLGSTTTMVLAIAYYRWSGWRRGALLVPTHPAGEEQAHPTVEPAGALKPAA